jgi:hypothetical protein
MSRRLQEEVADSMERIKKMRLMTRRSTWKMSKK